MRTFLTTLAFVVALPALAWAKPKVAVAPVDGDAEVQDAVTDALDGGEVTVVPPKQVSRTLEKLGLEGDLSDKELKKVANELDADAVIVASLSAKGGNKVLHFKMYVRGKKTKGFRIEFASAKSAKFKAALHDKLIEKIGSAGGGDDDDAKPAKKSAKKKAAADDDDDADAPKAKKSAKKKAADDSDADSSISARAMKKKAAAADDADDDKPAKKSKKAAAADDDDGKPAKKQIDVDSTGSGGDDDAKPAKGGDDDAPRKSKKRAASSDEDDDSGSVSEHVDVGPGGGGRAANRAAFRIDIGPSFTARSLTWNTRIFTEGLGNPRPYSNSAVPGARVQGEAYPLALSMPASPVAGLGLAGMYDKTISLTLHNALQPGVNFPANEFEWSIGPRYRLVFGDKPTSASLTVGVDYGHRQFKIDRTNANAMNGIIIDLPDVQYVGVTPNVTFRLPVSPMVAFVIGGGSLFATRAGDITQPGYYGQAKVTAVQAVAGVDVVFTKRLAMRLAGEFEQIGFAFTGTGAMANNRDGDPSSIDVGGATDRYYGGTATFVVYY